MLLKRLYLWLMTVWQYIANAYEDSILGKFISKIFGFFEKKSKTSLILTYFRERFFDMSVFKHSFAAKLVFLPFKLLRDFYNRCGQKIVHFIKDSKTARFVSGLPSISSRHLGMFLMFLGLGALAGTPITGGFALSEIWIPAALAIFGAILLPVKDSFFNVFMYALKLFLEINSILL